MPDLDPRQHAYRPDLADTRLEGQVEAARFTAGRPARVGRGTIPLRLRPEGPAGLASELLYGERVRVFDEKGGWAWVQNETDGYVGYCPAAGLRDGEKDEEPTHRVTALRSFLYPKPDLKLPVIDVLTLSSSLRVIDRDKGFARLADGNWIFARHLAAAKETEPDFVATALRFLDVPYLWGGRSSLGLDCSTLLQLSLAMAGLRVPRDSDQQESAIGEPLPWPAGGKTLKRGDLIFCRGHIAIALDEEEILHANAHHMAVAIEPWRHQEARLLAANGVGFRSRRRVV